MRAPAWFVLFLSLALPVQAHASDAMAGLSERVRERVRCSIAAAEKFEIPAAIVLAVAEMEGGKPGQWVRNKNGSYDVGPMQLNTRYLKHLQDKYGITPEDVAAEGCYPYEVAAWRLHRHLKRDKGDVWTRVANYHSRTPRHNAKYQRRLVGKLLKWQRWLSRRLPEVAARAGGFTVDDTNVTAQPADVPVRRALRAFGEADAEARVRALLDDTEADGSGTALLTSVEHAAVLQVFGLVGW